MQSLIKFPSCHDWPFFYTVQEHTDTRQRQLKQWTEVILHFCKVTKSYEVGVTELFNSAVCINTKINRRLSINDLHAVVEYMIKNGFAHYTSDEKTKLYVYWTSIPEYANAIHKWVKDTGRIGSVEEVVTIATGDETKGQIFNGIPVELVLKALKHLEKENKAEVFYSEETDAYGVKFFHH